MWGWGRGPFLSDGGKLLGGTMAVHGTLLMSDKACTACSLWQGLSRAWRAARGGAPAAAALRPPAAGAGTGRLSRRAAANLRPPYSAAAISNHHVAGVAGSKPHVGSALIAATPSLAIGSCGASVCLRVCVFAFVLHPYPR